MPRNSRLERAIFSTNFQLNVSGSGYFSQFNIVIFFNVVLIILIANPEHLFPQSLYYMNDATAWAGRQRRYKLAGVRANRSLMVLSIGSTGGGGGGLKALSGDTG